MPIFHTEKGLLFFSHIPKCAGMSIEKAFSNYPTHLKNPNLHGKNQLGFPCSPQHFHAEIIQKMFNEESFIFTFTVVRNPFDRILSEYRFRADIAQRQSREMMPFDEWLQNSLAMYRDNKFVLDNHLRPQVEFLLPDMKVFKLENGLADIFKKLQGSISEIQISPPTSTNVSTSAKPTLTAKSIESIQKTYVEDFQYFNYPVTPN